MALFGDRKGPPSDLLVVGLGNPGKEYEGTRHNIGFACVSLLASRFGATLKLEKERALVAEVRRNGKRMMLAMPQTFMNDSGVAVRALIKRSGIEDLEQLVVVHDELDLDVGRIHVKLGGGIAGHNGLRSIVQHVKSEQFGRIRIGIGRPPHKGSEHVLKRPPTKEAQELAIACETAADAVEELLLDNDYLRVMNRYNSRPST